MWLKAENVLKDLWSDFEDAAYLPTYLLTWFLTYIGNGLKSIESAFC